MSDYWFPSAIKPLTNKTYAMSRGSNVQSTAVQGGIPRQRKKYSYDVVPITLNFSMCAFHYEIFLNFYDAAIDGGASSFKMMLDSGTGIVEHQVQISGGFNADLVVHDRWHMSFTATAQVTPSQLDLCDNKYQLYNCYGDDIFPIIDGLEAFAVGVPFNE